MGPGETIGLIAAVVLGIVLIAAVFATYSRRLQFKQRKLELEAGAHAAGAAGSGELIARLEKRVRVLERLATERGPDVAAQIEALREDRALADLSTTGETVK
jgi:Zn-dependent protease with chaperone function